MKFAPNKILNLNGWFLKTLGLIALVAWAGTGSAALYQIYGNGSFLYGSTFSFQAQFDSTKIHENYSGPTVAVKSFSISSDDYIGLIGKSLVTERDLPLGSKPSTIARFNRTEMDTLGFYVPYGTSDDYIFILSIYYAPGFILDDDFSTIPDYGIKSNTLAGISFDSVPFFSFGQLNSISIRLLDGAVPEPSAWAMMIGGLGAVGASLRRQRYKYVGHA